jgi:hypothetical protein
MRPKINGGWVQYASRVSQTPVILAHGGRKGEKAGPLINSLVVNVQGGKSTGTLSPTFLMSTARRSGHREQDSCANSKLI